MVIQWIATGLLEAWDERRYAVIFVCLMVVVLILQFLLPHIIPSWRSSLNPGVDNRGDKNTNDTVGDRAKLHKLLVDGLDAINLSYEDIFEVVSYTSFAQKEVARKKAQESHDRLELVVRKVRGYTYGAFDTEVLLWWRDGIGPLLGKLSFGELDFRDEEKQELKSYRTKLREWIDLYDA